MLLLIYPEIIADKQFLISEYSVHVDPYCNQCEKKLTTNVKCMQLSNHYKNTSASHGR